MIGVKFIIRACKTAERYKNNTKCIEDGRKYTYNGNFLQQVNFFLHRDRQGQEHHPYIDQNSIDITGVIVYIVLSVLE